MAEFILFCERCEVSWSPNDWRTTAQHPSGLGGHVVSVWERKMAVDTEVEIRAAKEFEATRKGSSVKGAE